jgi:P-type E1-E2 ATPase
VPWQAVPAYGDMAPEDKAAAVRDLQDKGHRTCFVGDGINDASAMAQSDVSIAIDTGAALAVAAADFTIAQSALHALPEAIDVARASLKVIRSNLWIAAAYNTAAMAVAAAGYLHPAFAATVMLCSSLLVTVRAAWRLS